MHSYDSQQHKHAVSDKHRNIKKAEGSATLSGQGNPPSTQFATTTEAGTSAQAQILRLNVAGSPVEWLTWQEATTLYARDLVTWTLGDTVRKVWGGTSRFTGKRSTIELHSIIACAGELYNARPKKATLNNRILFRRDQNICMYCGKEFPDRDLSCDHIMPTSRGGRNIWVNVVAACKRCNHYKQDRTPEEAHMELIALPFEPNAAEYLALLNSKRIRADQMDFLKAQFSKNCRLQ